MYHNKWRLLCWMFVCWVWVLQVYCFVACRLQLQQLQIYYNCIKICTSLFWGAIFHSPSLSFSLSLWRTAWCSPFVISKDSKHTGCRIKLWRYFSYFLCYVFMNVLSIFRKKTIWFRCYLIFLFINLQQICRVVNMYFLLSCNSFLSISLVN